MLELLAIRLIDCGLKEEEIDTLLLYFQKESEVERMLRPVIDDRLDDDDVWSCAYSVLTFIDEVYHEEVLFG